MITVYRFVPAWGMLDISPFCVKLITYLKLAGIPHRCEVGNPLLAPKGKLPYIRDGERVVTDSSFIIDYLIEKHGDVLGPLSEQERAQSTAFQALFEEHLYFVLLYYRWKPNRSWAIYRPILSDFARALKIPPPIRSLVPWQARRTVLRQLQAQGLGRHDEAEIAQIARRLLDAVEAQLGDRPFFLGDRPRPIDATAYAFLSAILDPPLDNAARQHAARLPVIASYCRRLKQQYELTP